MGKANYKSAGVDIDAGNEAVNRIKDSVRSTFTSNVLTGLGSFGSLYDLKPIFENYENPVMVQSIDGVGTKTIIWGRGRMASEQNLVAKQFLKLVAISNPVTALGTVLFSDCSQFKFLRNKV